MSSAPTMDAEFMSKIGFAMGCISFADDDLDACLAELGPVLAAHGVEVAVIDPEHIRIGIAQSLALAAALKNIYDVESLETLMLTVGFFSEPDVPALPKLKAIALDCALDEAITLELASDTPAAKEDAERLGLVRERTADLLAARGIAVDYFSAVQKSKVS